MKTNTLNNFYLFCDGEHRELYSVLLYDWQEMGLAYCCDAKVLSLGINSVIKGEMFVCFSLHTGGAEPAAIRIDMNQWRRQLGQEYTASFAADVRRLQGLSCQQRGDVFVIENPAHILAPTQKKLRNMMHQFGATLPNKVAG
ncbi:MAG: hypothetical protein COB41_05015 [Proteobacteria bacterium]|nr:MAG: hypothetical protein COB41_05015 [Pseudomonadota bacterium]